MKLYTERHGIRKPIEKTYTINTDMYSLLLDCCLKYKKNLTHIFKQTCYDSFTNADYIDFNEKEFYTRIKIKIPSLYRNDYGTICSPEEYDEYDQYSLLDFIEYFAQNIRDITERWNDERYKNYKTIIYFETSNVFLNFQKEINEIFDESGLLYKLTSEKIIERIVENSPLTADMEKDFTQVNESGTHDLLKDAIALYKTPNPAARQDSVEKIWDAFERLKTYYVSLGKKKSSEKIISDMAQGNSDFFKLFDEEFRTLTSIGNDYRIRHHETDKIDITDVRYYDYLFNRCLSLIALVVKYI